MSKPYVVAIEEHYLDQDILKVWGPGADLATPDVYSRLLDLSDARIEEMDAAGIDLQVLSLAPPATQKLEPAIAAAVARSANDRLREVVRRHPDRFRAFAALPTSDPNAAADELERAVVDLGFKGAMIHGLSYGEKFVDTPEFWPIYERAQALDVPIYMHPSFPHPAVMETYLGDYLKDYPVITKAAWGFTMETATQAIRLVLSGVFARYPRLKIILGHMGEGLPFLLWRINDALMRPRNRPVAFRDIFRENFYVTTSGNFSDSALQCTIAELGIERILFSIDYPWAGNKPGVEWMSKTALSDQDREKIFSGNARSLLKL